MTVEEYDSRAEIRKTIAEIDNVLSELNEPEDSASSSDLEEAAITDGCGNKRDYDATHSAICPYKCTERKKRVKKDNSLRIEF